MKQFTLKLACLLGLLLSWGGDSWAQTLTPVTSLDDINEKDTYVLQYNGGYGEDANNASYKTKAYFYAASATATQISCSANYDFSTNGYFFNFVKNSDGTFKIKNKLTENYLSKTSFAASSTTDWVIACNSEKKAFCLAYNNGGSTDRTFYKVLIASATSVAITSKTVYSTENVSETLAGMPYTNIYKVEKVETVNVTIKYYNEDGSLIVSKALTPNKGKKKISELLETIPTYIDAKYYLVGNETETEISNLSTFVSADATYKVVTKYNENFAYPKSSTDFFALRSSDANSNYYYLGTSKGITTPAYSNRRSIAVKIEGDWYNGYSIIAHNNTKLYLNGSSVSFDADNDYKWKIDNDNRFVDGAGKFLQVTQSYLATTSWGNLAAKLASTEAAEAIKNSAPSYVGSLDKSKADGITFDDLIKDNFAKLALEVGKYYFIETANDPTNAISSAEVAYIYSSSTLASKAQKIKASHSFPELWKYDGAKLFVNANTGHYLDPSGELTVSHSGWAHPLKPEETNNDETVFQMKVSSAGTYKDKYLEIFNDDVVKATQTTTNFAGWRFRLAESIDIKLTKNGDKSYATTCAPVAVTLPGSDETTTLFVENSHTDKSISLTGKTAVAANTGIYVMNTAGATSATLLLANSGEASQANDAILKGTTVTQDISSADHSLLRTLGFNNKNEIGFFKPASSITSIPANRAYLKLPSGSATNAFYIDFDGTTTSIDELLPAADVLDSNAPIYDLSGRRMQGTLHKGIYIQNGRKFMVK